MMRQAWVDKEDEVTVVRQCVLAGVSRATVYAQQKPKPVDESDLLIARLIDEEYTRHPFYGSRRMVVFLGGCPRIGRLLRKSHFGPFFRSFSLNITHIRLK
ncbi:MAG: hypothetical protein DSZ28_05280 [Thiothrix sp.]|nr:MAG: hypothetical protein DSZ28_05280 [Thiothrix sp.]